MGMAPAFWAATPVEAQALPSDVVSSFKNAVGSRVEAAVVLSGDYGLSGASFSQASTGTERRSVDANVSKFGGAGDIGDPRPLGNFPIDWQPRLQGSMGYLTHQRQLGIVEEHGRCRRAAGRGAVWP